MTLRVRVHACITLCAVALIAAGCGQASLSPTGPSGTGSLPGLPSSTGVEINGTMEGLTRATASSADATPTFSTSANSGPVTVTVVGTNITATIDNSGRFWLTGVPTGNVQLKFTGPGLDATLTLNDVQEGDRISIKVKLNGNSIRIEAERRERRGRGNDDDDDDDDDDGDELKGAASAVSGSCPAITFTLGSTTVKTNDQTRYEDGVCADVKNGVEVEVHGTRQSDNSFLAQRIEIED